VIDKSLVVCLQIEGIRGISRKSLHTCHLNRTLCGAERLSIYL